MYNLNINYTLFFLDKSTFITIYIEYLKINTKKGHKSVDN